MGFDAAASCLTECTNLGYELITMRNNSLKFCYLVLKSVPRARTCARPYQAPLVQM